MILLLFTFEQSAFRYFGDPGFGISPGGLFLNVVVLDKQVNYAVEYCPRTIALKKGHIVYDGPTRNLTREMLNELYGAESEDLFGKKEEEIPPLVQGAAA